MDNSVTAVEQDAVDTEFAGQRLLSGTALTVMRVTAIVLPALTIVVGFTGWFDTMTRRAGHLMLAIPLIFLLYPASKDRGGRPTPMDWVLSAGAFLSFGWVVLGSERILWRFVYVDPVSWPDMIFGWLAVLLVIEATRRTLGWTLVFLTGGFLLYAFAGPYMPGILEHKGIPAGLLIEHLYLVPEGLFSQITGIIATYLLVFLTFGTFLRFAGGERIFLQLAVALTGRTAGGPAKAAVVGSALMGSISGSTIANVVTTGTVTIPLMTRGGYRPHEAAAIETAAGTGGAIMPPMMGAGVFVMSEMTGIPLGTILAYSILPAFVYFGSLFVYVHVKAKKGGLRPLVLAAPVDLRRTIATGVHLLAPLVLLVYLLLSNYSPFYAASVSVVVLVLTSYARRETRLTPRRLLCALEGSTRAALMLSATAASAAAVVGVITITGLMLKVTAVMVALAGGILFVGIVLVATISTVVGIALPVTSTYIIVSALGAAGLTELGASPLAAHLIIFWFAQTATITPPVCMTAFVAAAIAKAPPMRTGFEAMRIGKALYLVPLMFAYTNILTPPAWRMVLDATAALAGLAMMTCAVEGYFRGPLGISGRAIVATVSVCCFVATFTPLGVGAALWLSLAVALLASLSVAQGRSMPAVQRASETHARSL